MFVIQTDLKAFVSQVFRDDRERFKYEITQRHGEAMRWDTKEAADGVAKALRDPRLTVVPFGAAA